MRGTQSARNPEIVILETDKPSPVRVMAGSNSAKVKFTDTDKHINATQDRVFNPNRDYYWPMPPNDVTTENGVLIQNPGW